LRRSSSFGRVFPVMVAFRNDTNNAKTVSYIVNCIITDERNNNNGTTITTTAAAATAMMADGPPYSRATTAANPPAAAALVDQRDRHTDGRTDGRSDTRPFYDAYRIIYADRVTSCQKL